MSDAAAMTSALLGEEGSTVSIKYLTSAGRAEL